MAKKKQQKATKTPEFTDFDKQIVWYFIENKFFVPTNPRGWIIEYGKFLKNLLGLEAIIDKPTQTGREIKINSPINFIFGEFSFSINLNGTTIEKFGFTIIIDEEKFNFHFDNDYKFEDKIPEYNKIDLEIKLNDLQKHGKFENIIREILINKIVHPALHNHPSTEIFKGVRLGFAIDNPFLFLYKLAFQLIERGADFNDKRFKLKEQELNRLTKNILENFDLKVENKINLKKLFYN